MDDPVPSNIKPFGVVRNASLPLEITLQLMLALNENEYSSAQHA